MNGRNVLKLDKDSIAEFQKEIYNGTEDKPDIGTRFSLALEKRAQSNHIKNKLDQVPGREGQIIYTASNDFDYLFKLSAHINLFPIRVKKQYANKISICYHHNLGHNILQMGEAKIDKGHLAYIDTISMDIFAQFFEDNWELYNEMIGNIPCLENWTTELPAKPLIVPQKFSFARATQVSLPILKSSNNSITFEYKLRTKLTELLRMRMLKDGEYKEIKCNLNYLEFKSDNIPVPEMWGRYADISDEERNWRKSVDEKTGQPNKQIIYIEDIAMTCSKNPKALGTTDVIPLESTSPAKHIFWVASLVNGNLSNYTTNRYDVYKGFNPCAKSSITYGGSPRVEEIGHEHFDLSECYDFQWKSFPREGGYNVHTYTFQPTNMQYADSAVILKECGAALNVTLDDTNPFINIEPEKEYIDENGDPIPVEALDNRNSKNTEEEKYIIHVRTVVQRKLEVYWDEKFGGLKYIFNDK